MLTFLLRGVQWRIGSSIGLGGFGEIYAASCLVKKGNGGGGGANCFFSEEDYIVKVEPHTNGPLFVEIAFYLKVINYPLIIKLAKPTEGLSLVGVTSYFCRT